ncbi:hypothetical protein D3C86_2176020 [compost metagenome]
MALERLVSFDFTGTGLSETLGGATVCFHLRHVRKSSYKLLASRGWRCGRAHNVPDER